MSSSGEARADFQSARRKAFWRRVRSWLLRGDNALLAFEEVRRQLHVQTQHEGGNREVPIDQIVGSVGRYRDFDRAFLPRQDRTQGRWESVDRAHHESVGLPAIELEIASPVVDFQSFSGTRLADGRVLLLGIVGAADQVPQHGYAELFDPADETFQSFGPLTARQTHTATLLLDGSVLIVGGGRNVGGEPAYDTAELFKSADRVETPAEWRTTQCHARSGQSDHREPPTRTPVARPHQIGPSRSCR